MSTEEIKSVGELAIDEIFLTTSSGLKLDITPSVLEINLVETMLFPFVTGKIMMMDSKNFKSLFPLQGLETIDLVFYTPGTTPIRRKFNVISVSSSEVQGKSETLLTMDIISDLHGINLTQKISKSYKNLKRSEIIRKIFESYIQSQDPKKQLLISNETNEEPTSIVIPFQRPMDVMNTLTFYSQSENDQYDFVLFELLDGDLQFTSISKLKENPVFDTYYHNNKDSRVGPDSARNMSYETNKIIAYSEGGNLDDKYNNLAKGYYSSINLNFDITTKRITSYIFNYLQDFSQRKNLEKYPTIPVTRSDFYNVPFVKTYLTQTATKLYDGVENINNSLEAYPKRISQINLMNTQTINAVVPCDTRKKCGQVIEIKIASRDTVSTTSNEDGDDKRLSGKYLLNTIEYKIFPNPQQSGLNTMTLTLGRESTSKPPTDSAEIDL